jgi:D-alanyl-lipoteichoic acid acyltransferase DltB (MBOAT superfamily)
MIAGEGNAWYKKAYLIGAVTANLALLFYFKYFDFALDLFRRITGAKIDLIGIELPIGISFLRFKGFPMWWMSTGETWGSRKACSSYVCINLCFPN